jgi:CheY-like chemotaxis protein
VGIRPEDQQRIFEEFLQLGNPGRTSKKGMGLGLSIVKRLCGLLGYSIEIASEAGKGSTFGFEAPPGSAVLKDDKVAGAAKAGIDLTGRLVVVIDDEAAIVDGMKALLSGWGMDVVGSLSGDDVIAEIHTKGRMPDLIIADFRLAGGAVGTEVIERLRRELDPEIPAIVITGSTAPERIPEAEAGHYDLLLKPLQPDRLRELIGARLRRTPA